LKTLGKNWHRLLNKHLFGIELDFLVQKRERNQTHPSGRTLTAAENSGMAIPTQTGPVGTAAIGERPARGAS
jgi:hypothetical protein